MYRAIANLIPRQLDRHLALHIFDMASEAFQTVAYSVDDAIELVTGPEASPESYIKVWSPAYLSDWDLNQLLVVDRVKEWWHHPLAPKLLITDLVERLPSSGAYQTRDVSDVHTITIHHSGSTPTQSDLFHIEAINRYHISRDWPRIGYHYVVGPTGSIYQVNNLETKSYHAGTLRAEGDENETSIGVCLLGNFVFRQPPMPQVLATSAIVQYLQKANPNMIAVSPHKLMPGAATACPGSKLEEWFPLVVSPWRYLS